MAGLLVFVVLMIRLAGGKTPTASSVYFDNLKTYATSLTYVEHMEVDLYKNDGSILFSDVNYLKTTNGKSYKTLVLGFVFASGFLQITNDKVVVVDNLMHCLRLIDRKTNSNKRLVGTCHGPGFADGKSAKFYHRWDIEFDERNPGNLLVTDFSNGALRSVDVEAATVSTIIRSGLYIPRGLTWYKGRLLIANNHYISELSWDDRGVVTNKRLTAGASAGYKDGGFSQAMFSNPHEIRQIGADLFLIADYGNHKLRLLDMAQKMVKPVCFGPTDQCTFGSALLLDQIVSVLKTDDAVYVGLFTKIVKVAEGLSNRTIYIQPHKEKALVRVSDTETKELSPGVYPIKAQYGGKSFTFYANVLANPVIGAASFKTEYDVKCASLDNTTKPFLQSTLAQRKAMFQTICGADCTMSTTIEPWFTCENDVITAYWPTDTLSDASQKKFPPRLAFSLAKRLRDLKILPEIVILTASPPLVAPKKQVNGNPIQMSLASTCPDPTYQYVAKTDSCVRGIL